ncbi:MAG: amidohydrolase family protein [Burkholderiaceae bacterium]|nr:amidohydrolase family protein [Burkholderiaceae bacterium]
MSGCPFCAIDVHTHVVPGHFPPYAGRTGLASWPSMQEAQPCHRHVMIDGKVYRTVSDRAWDGKLRIVDMDELSLRAQVLSPMPELLSYWMDVADATQLLRFINSEIAAMVAAAPGRFFGLGAVPLQDIDAAISELDHAVNVLGLSGIEIAGNVNGVPIGDPQFAPFWAAAADLGAAVFIHPLRPTGMDRLVGPKPLQQLLAFPSESGLALASLITGGVIERHPGLRIASSHGGGTLSALLPRLQQGWNSMPAVRESMPSAPMELARKLYYDSLVYDTRTLAGLIDIFGDTQIMVGSDYPFQIRDKNPVGSIEKLTLAPDVLAKVLWQNALRWLNVPAENFLA